MYKAVFFDLDGTLINTNSLIIDSFKHTIKYHLNIDYPEEKIVKFFGEPLLTSLERVNKDKASLLLETYLKYNEKMHDDLVTSFKGVKEGLLKLKSKGIKLAIVTSKRKVMAERGLKVTGLYDYFDLYVTPENTKKHKPYGDPCLYALKELSLDKCEALMVGDSTFDILCGKNAGIKTCAVNYSLIPKKDLKNSGADYFIDDISDIVNL